MRFMILIKSDEKTEQGAVPDERLINEMGMFNARMEKAGVLRGGEGLTPSREGARLTITEEKRTVTDGPFAEAKELVAGFWIIEVGSLAEAVEWARQVPDPHQLPDSVICYLDSTVALPLVTAYALSRHAPRPPRRLMDRLESLTQQLQQEYSAKGRKS